MLFVAWVGVSLVQCVRKPTSPLPWSACGTFTLSPPARRRGGALQFELYLFALVSTYSHHHNTTTSTQPPTQEYFALEDCLGENDRDFRLCKASMDMLKKCSDEQRLKKAEAAAALAAGGKPAPAATKQQK